MGVKKKNVLAKYWEGYRKKEYTQYLLLRAMKRCHFVNKEVITEFKNIVNVS